MLNKLKIPICAALSSAMLVCTASADIGAAITVDEAAGKVSISGTTGETKSCGVTLAVLKHSGDTDIKEIKLYDLSEKQKASLYLREIQSDNGNFSFDFSPVSGSGAYDCIISFTDNEKPYFTTFNYVDANEQQQFLDLINNGSADDVFSAVNANLDGVFAAAEKTFGALTESGQKNAVAALLKNKPFEMFKSAADFLCRVSIIENFAETGDIELISENEETLGFAELGISKKDSDFKSEIKERIKTVSADSDFNTVVSQAVYLTALHKAENVSEIKGIMNNLNKCGVDLAKYFSLSTTQDIDSKIIGNYYTADSLKEFVDGYTLPQKNNNKGGGGGSGGGSGYTSKGNVSAVTSEVTQNEPEKTAEFSDVPADCWAYASITALYKKGVVSGTEDGRFLPEAYVTRREFVKIVINSLSLYDENAVCAFSDVAPDDWGYKYIASAYEKRIISGKDEKTFAPDDAVTREEAAHILYKAAGANSNAIPKLNEIKDFTDSADISEYAKGSVTALCAGGIISGYPDGSFAPRGNVTRGECAQLAINMLKNIR